MFIKRYFVVVNFFLLMGCNSTLLGTYGENQLTLAEFEKYVESVFQLQNSVTSEVMLMTEENAEILDAEQSMRNACASLNDYAENDIDGVAVSFELKKRVEKTAHHCEKAAQHLQHLLAKR